MELKFTKMQGLGNDFMVIDQINQDFEPNPEQIKAWSDRNTGIGFDQLLLVSEPTKTGVEFRYRIFNADGSEVEQCGNGARCFARFVAEKGLTQNRSIPVETCTGNILLELKEDDNVTVNMGQPILAPDAIPLMADSAAETYEFLVDNTAYQLSCISMGNPHGVLLVNNTETAPVNKLGPRLENHPKFPNRANIGFMQIIDRSSIKLRVFERGVGETRACGTGACAAAVAAIQRGLTDNVVAVTLPGGTLQIEWQGGNAPVLMTGPATTVYEGILVI